MKSILLPILFIISFSSFSQNQLIGLKGGVSRSNISSNELTTDNGRTGFTLGVTYDNQIKKNLIIGGELQYQQRGCQIYISFVDDFGNAFRGSEKTKFYYEYLSLPLKAGYIVGNKFSGYFNVGLVPSVLLKSKYILPEMIIDNNIDATEFAQKFDLAGLIEIGGIMKISERIAITALFAYQHSFTSYTKPGYFWDIKAKHYAMMLSAGVKYALKKD